VQKRKKEAGLHPFIIADDSRREKKKRGTHFTNEIPGANAWKEKRLPSFCDDSKKEELPSFSAAEENALFTFWSQVGKEKGRKKIPLPGGKEGEKKKKGRASL